MTAPKTLATLEVTLVRKWRAWLAAHHDRATEIWLVFYKKHTGKPSIAYQDALDEALCFGWIDSLVRRLDDERYAQKFTPRKMKSKWSEANRRLFARLVEEGRMTAAGLAKAPPAADSAGAGGAGPGGGADAGPGPGESSSSPPPRQARREASGDEVPGYIESALRAHGEAWMNFTKLAPSHRRLYVRWIEAAKREETRRKRLAEAVTLLARNEKLGMK